MEAYCKYNPRNNPHWCNVIWGYCQFQIPSYVNQNCPIYQGYPNWEIHVDRDVDDKFIQTYSYATIYDDGEHLVSLGDTAFQRYPSSLPALELDVRYVRYVGRYAFQDCLQLKTLDFSRKTDDFIPVLASPEAFMKSETGEFINDTFEIRVPAAMYEKWIQSPNWTALKKHIKGI